MTWRVFILGCVRLIPWMIALVLLSAYVFSQWPPSGVRHLSFPFDGRSPWFDTFLPADRVSQPQTWSDGWTGQRIFMEPVYATLRAPGPYEHLRVMLDMRFWKQPLVELGVLRDPVTMAYEMTPVWSEALSRGWREVTQGGVHGYVREDLPDTALVTTDIDHTLVWYATSTPVHAMDHGGAWQSYDVSLRGGHEIETIPVDGSISFTLSLQDMNRTPGQNTVALRVSRDNETLWTDTIQTSALQDDTPSRVFDTTIHLSSLEPAVYHLSITSGDDIFIRRISTNATHWVLGPRLYLGDTVGYKTTYAPVPIWTNSQHLAVQTFHNEGLQTVTFGTSAVTVSSTHQSYPLDRLPKERNGAQTIGVPRGDMRIIGDGFFAFSPQALFLPSPRRLTDASDPLGEGIQAVITPYVAPTRTDDGWWRVLLNTSISPQDARPKLTMAAPGILSRQGSIDIRYAELTYLRTVSSFTDWLPIMRAQAHRILKRFAL